MSNTKSILKVRAVRIDPKVLAMCKKLHIDINKEVRDHLDKKIKQKLSSDLK